MGGILPDPPMEPVPKPEGAPSPGGVPKAIEPEPGLGRQLLSLALWLLVALLLRWAVIEPRWIPSGSMLPTLQLQDRILVEKVRPKLHRPLKPGSVVVFHPPPALVEAGYDPGSALIKRVVAAAGDQVEVRDGLLYRNGRPVPMDWGNEPMDYSLDPLTVPPHNLLVLGDNRNASLDSHLWGPLPGKDVIGTAVWRYWPLNRFGPLRFSAPTLQELKPSHVG